MSAATDIITSRDNLITIVTAKTEAWVLAGCPPTYSIDGISVDWLAWLRGMNDAIKAQTDVIQVIGGPYTATRQVKG